jgi:hypothetical protein
MNPNIDLNVDPPILNLRSLLCVKIIVQKKLASREMLVQKFGEEGYNTIMASSEPLMLFRVTAGQIFIIIMI